MILLRMLFERKANRRTGRTATMTTALGILVVPVWLLFCMASTAEFGFWFCKQTVTVHLGGLIFPTQRPMWARWKEKDEAGKIKFFFQIIGRYKPTKICTKCTGTQLGVHKNTYSTFKSSIIVTKWSTTKPTADVLWTTRYMQPTGHPLLCETSISLW